MSSVPSLLQRTETYGTAALCRSRRMAVACTCGLGMVLLAVLCVERTVHLDTTNLSTASLRVPPLPAIMDMRVLPPVAPSRTHSVQPSRVLQREEADMRLPLPAPASVVPETVTPEAVTPEPVVPKPVAPVAEPQPEPQMHTPPAPVTPPQKVAKARQKARPAKKTAPSQPVSASVVPPVTPSATTSAKTDVQEQAVPGGVEGGVPGGGGEGVGERAGEGPVSAQAQRLALHVLMQAIEQHKQYPRQARRTNAQGTVELMVRIGQDGRVQGCAIQTGSGSSILDSAARQLAEKLHGIDSGLRGGAFQVVVPVRYSLM